MGSESGIKVIKLRPISRIVYVDKFSKNINNRLNDNLLVGVFKHLPIKDKLTIELVCKKWRRLAKLSWSNVKSLEISHKFIFKIFKIVDKEKHPRLYWNLYKRINNFILNVILRCGCYLNNLIIQIDVDLNFLLLFKKIFSCCSELTNFSLRNNPLNKKFRFDRILDTIFKKNTKLSNLALEDLKINGICLLSLHADSILELKLVNCIVEAKDYLLNLFALLRNINILHLNLNIETIEIVKSLSMSCCENIHEFSLFSSKSKIKYDKDLSKLLSKQKFLFKIATHIAGSNKNENFLINIPTDSLQTLDILALNPCIISRFKNLKHFICKTFNLTDEFMKNFSGCINLETINIQVFNSIKLTSDGLKYFARFKNLKKFVLFGTECNIDNILIAVSKCQNIREIEIKVSIFTDIGLNSLRQLPNLTVFNVSWAVDLNVHKLISIISKLKNLELIRFTGYRNSNYELLKNIDTLKINRGDKHILKVIMFVNKKEYDKLQISNINNFSSLSLEIYLKGYLFNYDENDNYDDYIAYNYLNEDDTYNSDNGFGSDDDSDNFNDYFDSSDDSYDSDDDSYDSSEDDINALHYSNSEDDDSDSDNDSDY